MKIIHLTSANHQEVIKETLTVLSSGGLVVFPTDTVYGLLADATNPKTIDKLLAFKERPAGKAISVFMANEIMASNYVVINTNAKNIIKNLLPGPFTVICKYKEVRNGKWETGNDVRSENVIKSNLTLQYPASHFNLPTSNNLSGILNLDPRLLAENGTLGFRIPDCRLILELVRQFGKPIIATSANISSTPPHYSVSSLTKSLKSPKKLKLLSLVIDAGILPKNKPSTVIDTTAGELKTLRFGDLLPATPNSLISQSEADTMKLAEYILSKTINKNISKPMVFLLQGELGTGKTIFTKGLGKALGVKEEIVSPTYTICYEYRIPMSFQTSPAGSGINSTRSGIYIDSRFRGNDNVSRGISPSVPKFSRTSGDMSTENGRLSTQKPILNRQSFDIDRQDQNNYSMYQVHNIDVRNERCEAGKRNEKCDNLYFNKSSSPTSSSSFPFPTSHFNHLVHYDLYRIESPQDLKEIKFLESIRLGNIYSIEWPERIDKKTLEELKKKAFVVYIKIKHKNKKQREIECSE